MHNSKYALRRTHHLSVNHISLAMHFIAWVPSWSSSCEASCHMSRWDTHSRQPETHHKYETYIYEVAPLSNSNAFDCVSCVLVSISWPPWTQSLCVAYHICFFRIARVNHVLGIFARNCSLNRSTIQMLLCCVDDLGQLTFLYQVESTRWEFCKCWFGLSLDNVFSMLGCPGIIF